MSNQTPMKRPARGLAHLQVPATGKKLQTANYVSVPKDMYLHRPNVVESPDSGCPTEWWWHIGTLTTPSGERTFGFEINACAFYPDGFSEVMLTDVNNQIHYHETKANLNVSADWAESDPTKPWKVELEQVSMTTGADNKTNPSKKMLVTASLSDQATNTKVDFDLTFEQKGQPLFVFGDGMTPLKPGQTKPSLKINNFYFSLTRLAASGTITITKDSGKPEVIDVLGTTWMDHEWGNFSSQGNNESDTTSSSKSKNKSSIVQWILQDMQLDNGICLSNFALELPSIGKPTPGKATVQLEAEGNSLYVDSLMIPIKSETYEVITKKGLVQKTYFTEIFVSVPEFGLGVTVTSSFPKQLFEGGLYEGVATAKGYQIPSDGTGSPVAVSGTAWVEQNIF